jgi:hypothetical protein
MDLIEQLEANVQDQELTVPGSRGQLTASPLLAELRHQRAALARLLSQLGTDDSDDAEPMTAQVRAEAVEVMSRPPRRITTVKASSSVTDLWVTR